MSEAETSRSAADLFLATLPRLLRNAGTNEIELIRCKARMAFEVLNFEWLRRIGGEDRIPSPESAPAAFVAEFGEQLIKAVAADPSAAVEVVRDLLAIVEAIRPIAGEVPE